MPDATMRALARAVDAKDSGTGDHSLRVGRLAKRLAEWDRWSTEDAHRLGAAGFVHDVGKLGIDGSILLKPGRLTEDEYRLIKLHPEIGEHMLANDGHFDEEQREWVRHHHERPDGRGYPDGLVFSQITRGACLLALADSWDVMTSTRPYKQAMSDAVALEEVRAGCGCQFMHCAVVALERLLGAS